MELGGKIDEFQEAFKDLLGLDLIAFRSGSGGGRGGGPGSGGAADETAPSVAPGQAFSVRATSRRLLDRPAEQSVAGEHHRRAVEDRGYGRRLQDLSPGDRPYLSCAGG